MPSWATTCLRAALMQPVGTGSTPYLEEGSQASAQGLDLITALCVGCRPPAPHAGGHLVPGNWLRNPILIRSPEQIRDHSASLDDLRTLSDG